MATGSEVRAVFVQRLLVLAHGQLAQLLGRDPGRAPLVPRVPGALVPAAFCALASAGQLGSADHARFLRAAGRVIRHLLLEEARRLLSGDDRGLAGNGRRRRTHARRMVVLDWALECLDRHHGRPAALAELRLFAAATLPEAARGLDVPVAEARRDWEFARAWLARALVMCPDRTR
jgi:hypothetical protein